MQVGESSKMKRTRQAATEDRRSRPAPENNARTSEHLAGRVDL